MAEIIRMPKMSDTMEEGVLVKWLKREGDSIQAGDILAEVETDKAVMELENYEEGTLLHIAIKEGEKVPVNGLLAVIGKNGEDFSSLLSSEKASTSSPSPPPTSPPPSKTSSPVTSPSVDAPLPVISSPAEGASAGPTPLTSQYASSREALPSPTRTKASPLARKMASEKGYELTNINGSGEGGRIIRRDILAYQPQTQLAQGSFAMEKYTDEPVSQMRKTIALRLSESKFTAPHFYLSAEAEVSELVAAREKLNATARTKLSYNDLIVKATAQALRHHPTVNTSWQGDFIRQYEHIHIGVAVSVPDGLLVPVLRFADQKGLEALSTEIKELATQARDRSLKPEQWEGSTFSISNLGMYGIERFTAIINTPNSSILAVGGIQDKAVVKDGAVLAGKCLSLTLSCDHRVVDGAAGAAFLKTLKEFLENPLHMLL